MEAVQGRTRNSRTQEASDTATSAPSGEAAAASTWCGPLSAMRATWRGPRSTSTGDPSSYAQPLMLAA